MFMWTENIKEGDRYDIPPYTYKFEIDTDEKELLEDLKHVVFGMAERFGNEFAKIYGEMKTENGIANWKLTTKDRMVAGFLEIACEICKDRSDQNRETQRHAKGDPAGEVTIEVKTEGIDEALEKAKALRRELEADRELADELDKRLNAFKH
ncbi:MAG TPA: hypothetical protein H9846_01970 [Candidatus Gemmiger excrementipullorum]|uniref:Uncharacterized protein n=1 Tax=Candidatus Gemmiger excrementipullorum TaxID=2838610 RepID=A0A9D2BTA0_9FIRM|nr:hypothetical protein [Candidatus Gemmiger excrementipullorum]